MSEAVVKLLCFGRLSDLAGDLPPRFPLANNQCPDDIRRLLADSAPALAEALQQPQVLVAVNQQLCDWQQPLQDGDELAFLPPVTGG